MGTGLSSNLRSTGLDKAYVLNAGDKNKSISIDGIAAERVCYRAWTLGQHCDALPEACRPIEFATYHTGSDDRVCRV